MIILIFIIAVICATIGFIVAQKSFDYEELGITVGILGSTFAAGAIIAAIVVGAIVTENSIIDEHIAMYTEENTKIENQIAEIISQYQNYETDIFTELKVDNSITLASLYPELKSDTLVQSQIAIYINNNNTIKSLRENKLHDSIYRWWLYFGK